MDISSLLQFNKYLPVNKTRLLMGEAGIGKSSIVRQIAAEDDAEVIDLRLREWEPPDLVGLPYLEKVGDTQITKNAQPFWWPANTNRKIYLLLDELDRCREDMQASAMQLVLDRAVGGRKLPDNVVIWAACNGEKYMTLPIDQALMNRVAAIKLTPTVEEWLEWAKQTDVHPAVINYIEANPYKLDTPPEVIGKPNIATPSRRSWSDLGSFLSKIPDITQEKNLQEFASCFIGYEYASLFCLWLETQFESIDLDDVFGGNATVQNTSLLDASFAAQQAANLFMKKEAEQQYNCAKFFMDLGEEYFACFFEALPVEAGQTLANFKDINQFIVNLQSV